MQRVVESTRVKSVGIQITSCYCSTEIFYVGRKFLLELIIKVFLKIWTG